ncbi:MAG TPA: hypothetical protein VFD59_01590 [Nocardioidaceae bacterium]|nr:hypothetical protein [Nocardioidaceae bacterium]
MDTRPALGVLDVAAEAGVRDATPPAMSPAITITITINMALPGRREQVVPSGSVTIGGGTLNHA